MTKKIAVIGHFAFGTDLCDGQTVKTITLYNALLCQSVKVTKVWEDSNNQEALRPASIVVNLKNENTLQIKAYIPESCSFTV